MRCLALAAMLCSSALSGAVLLTESPGRVHVEIDGRPFTDFYFGAETPKPYLHPLRAASGTVVTRGFPMEKIAGETITDQHQRAVFLGYSSVGGFEFWQNEFSYHKPDAGRVVTVKVGVTGDAINGVFRWLSPAGEGMLEETRTMMFSGDKESRIVDINVELRALRDTSFGDSKDGAFGIRLAEPLIEKNGGTITNSEGGRGMKETWGKRAGWVEYSGQIAGETLGVTLFDHPESFRHPARWHVRDYGLLAVNPFGSRAFDKEAPDATFTLTSGKAIRLRYRVVVHGALKPGRLAEMYREYTGVGYR